MQTSIHLSIQQEPQTRGLEGYGSSSSSPTMQRFIPIEHGQQEVQPIFTLGRTWRQLPEDMSQRSYGNQQIMESQQEIQTPGGKDSQYKGESNHYPSHRRTNEPDINYSYSFRLTRIKHTRLPSGSTSFRHQHISYQESPFFTIPGTL
ncbi:hypothetical protein O181_003601 [Austropuccinia psidii MF-1]|uniref:Uncharacterized protein n=1 Tax=Austropuccinia psidii MF-1 TaxID=1389203 RepID=A0A9Q3GEA6_9BASI|nr:hypothetical protein [Austropuccinia psidii MF-1]